MNEGFNNEYKTQGDGNLCTDELTWWMSHILLLKTI